MIRFLFHHGPHHHSGHGCNCKKTSCRRCSPMTCSVGVYGKDVYYGNNNLLRFHVSCGENFDSIIEKAFIYAENLSKEIDKLKLILNSESILSRIEELEADLTSLQNALDILKSNMGNNASLKTTHRLTLVGAINELYDSIVALGSGGGGSIDPQILQDITDLKAAVTLINTNIGSLTSLNTTVKTSLVNAINEVNNKIGNLNDLDTTDKTTVVAAINEVNAKVPVLGTLNNLPGVTTQATNFTDAINDRQPVWKKSLDVVIGSSQAAPFNDINTAIDELAKYHFSSNLLVLKLEDGTHTITPAQFHRININSYTVESVSGNRANCILTSTGATINNGLQYAVFKNLTVKSTGNSYVVSSFSNAYTRLDNCIIENHSSNTRGVVISAEGASLRLINCKIVNKATAAVHLVIASDHGSIIPTNLEVDNSAGNAGTNLYLSQVNSRIEVIYDNPVNTTVVDRINTVYTTYLDSQIVVLSYDTYNYNNINIFAHNLGLGGSIQHRCQTSAGVTKPTIVNGTGILFITNHGEINSTPITASGFERAFSVLNQSKLGCTITATGLTGMSWVDKHSDANIEGSSLTLASTVPASTTAIMFAGTSSRVDIRNGSLNGNTGSVVKLAANANASVFAVGSNLTTANSTIVAPAILMV